MKNMFCSVFASFAPLWVRMFALLLALAFWPGIASAAIIEWDGATGSWVDGSNWDGGTVPTTTDDPFIVNGGTATLSAGETGVGNTSQVTGGLQISGGLLSVAGLQIGWLGVGTATVTTGTMDVSNGLIVGGFGHGTLNVNGGLVDAGPSLSMGFHTTGTGVVNVTSGTLLGGSSVALIGDSGYGTMNISGGLVSLNAAAIGSDAGAVGELNLTGGILEAARIAEGSGTGTLNLDGGTLRAVASEGNFLQNFEAGDVMVGAGGAFIDSNGFAIGISTVLSGTGGLTKLGAGTLTLTGSNTYSGGTTISAGSLQIGNGGTTGSIVGDVVNNANLTFNRSDAVGFGGLISGTGTLTKNGAGALTLTGSNTHSGGTMLSAGGLVVGNNSALGTGALTIEGGTTLGSTAPRRIINDIMVNGDFDIFPGGTVVTVSAFELDGNMNLTGGNRTITNTMNFAAFEFGQVTIGGIISNGGLTFADNGFAVGENVVFFRLDGTQANTYTGDTVVSSNVSLALDKSDNVTAIAGDATVQTEAVLVITKQEQIADTSTVTLQGNGQLQIGVDTDVTETLAGILDDGGGMAQIELSANTIGSRLIVASGDFSGAITGGVAGGTSLEKSGTGTLALRGANTFAGETLISGGTLASGDLVNSTVVPQAGGAFSPGGSGAQSITVGGLNLNGGDLLFEIGTGGTDFINVADGLGALNAATEFVFTATGLVNGTYALLDGLAPGWNLGMLSFSGIAPLEGNFLLSADETQLFFSVYTGGVVSGAVLQNSAPTGIPTTADFLVNGVVATGGPTESNTINSLLFNPGSSLQIFNNLTVTSGNFNVPTGSAMMTGGTVIVPGVFTKLGGGILNIFSNVFVGGAANVAGGSLLVNGTFTVPGGLTVFQNALLGGAGIINGSVFNNGIVAPGNSPGVLTINGNFTQSSSGTLQIEFGDLLRVSGNASLAGTLQYLGGSKLRYGQQIGFLQAGSITGEFDEILVPSSDKFRGRFLADDGTGTLLIAPTSYTLVAETTNQRNVAKALDSYITARGDDREVVSIALDVQSEEQYPAAFDAIAPTYYESLGNIVIEQAFAQTQQMNQRLSAVRLGARGFQAIGVESPLVHDKDGKSVLDSKDVIPQSAVIDPQWNLWAMGNGLFAKVTNVSQVPDYRFDSGGFLFGADYTFGGREGSMNPPSTDVSSKRPYLTLGLYAGYEYTWADAGDAGNTQINSALFGGYASYSQGGFYADAILGGGYNGYQVRRSIEFSTVDRTARSQPNGGQLNTSLNLGYDWQIGKFTLGPIAGVQYTYAGIAGFTENGADSLDLRVAQQNVNSLRTTLGGRVAYTWNLTDSIALIPEVRMFWQHEFLNNPRNISSSLDGGAGPTFGYETSAPARDSVFAGAGVSAQLGDRWNAFVYYNIDFGRQDYLGNMISGGVNWKF